MLRTRSNPSNKMMSQSNSSTKNIEHLERTAVNDMTSDKQMELYMRTINPHIAKALRTNIHYGSRYIVTSVGDVIEKAEMMSS